MESEMCLGCWREYFSYLLRHLKYQMRQCIGIFRRPKRPWSSEMVAIFMTLSQVSGAGNEAIQIAVTECFSSACVAASPADNA